MRNIDKAYRLEFLHYLSTQNCRKGFIAYSENYSQVLEFCLLLSVAMISNKSVRVIEVFMIVSEEGQKLKTLTHSKTVFNF